MKLSKTKPNCLLLLILTFYITDVRSKASSHDEDLRVLIVGDERGVRYSTEVLVGKKESRLMNNKVITDDGQRMMVVSGPNPCFKNTEPSFKKALFLSSHGPHAVLMALDPESEQCDLLKHLHESLRSDVLQYCIVLLLQQQHHPEKTEDITAGKAGEMINACGGRFHKITDTDPRPALIAEINKLLRLNEGTFYSLELFKTLQDTEQTHIDEDAAEEVHLFAVVCLSLVLLVIIFVGIQSGNLLRFLSGFVALIAIEVTLRNNLRAEISIPLNVALSSSISTLLMICNTEFRDYIMVCFILSPKIITRLPEIFISNTKSNLICLVLTRFFLFLWVLSVLVGLLTSIRSLSDWIIAGHTALFIIVSKISLPFIFYKMRFHAPWLLMLGFFLCYMAAAVLSIGYLTAFNLFDIKITIPLYIFGLTMAYFYIKHISSLYQRFLG